MGAATLLLFAFAGAHIGAFAPQAPRLDSPALRSQAFSAHSLGFTLAHPKLVHNRRPAPSVVADASLPLFSQCLRFAGMASGETLTANDPARRRSPQPRAPPLS